MTTTLNQASKGVNFNQFCIRERVVLNCIDTDEMLLRKIRSGDGHALESLLRRYKNAICGLAFRLTQNYDDAQEVASETYLRITRYVVNIQNALTLPAWINRIVLNVYLAMRKSSQRKPMKSLDELIEMYGDSVLGAMYDLQTSPELILEAKERTAILNRAIALLSPTHRLLVELYHREQRSYEEIAGELNIPIGTVKSRLNRARSVLKNLLTPHLTALMTSL